MTDYRQPADFGGRGGVERSADRSGGRIVKAEHRDFRERDVDALGKIAEELRQLLRKVFARTVVGRRGDRVGAENAQRPTVADETDERRLQSAGSSTDAGAGRDADAVVHRA